MITAVVAGTVGAPLALRQDGTVLGLVELKDTVKPGLVDRFEEFRRMWVRTVMITGDNPLTAETIAAEAGVDAFIAEAKPEDKIAYIHTQQADGHLVAMTGDGTNDAPALAQADVGMAMNSGTSACKEAANMVDLDSDPTKLLQVIAIGKQLLITRGSITTFSIANDVRRTSPPDEPGAHRAGRDRCRSSPRGERRHGGSGRSRHELGFRARSTHQPGGSRLPGRSGRGGARTQRGRCPGGSCARHTEGQLVGFLGQPRVSVQELNLDLDGLLR